MIDEEGPGEINLFVPKFLFVVIILLQLSKAKTEIYTRSKILLC